MAYTAIEINERNVVRGKIFAAWRGCSRAKLQNPKSKGLYVIVSIPTGQKMIQLRTA